jgi:hypothetical protein
MRSADDLLRDPGFAGLDAAADRHSAPGISQWALKRHDYLPFGQEILAGIDGRATGLGYAPAPDSTTENFTGQDRDVSNFNRCRIRSNRSGASRYEACLKRIWNCCPQPKCRPEVCRSMK